MLQQKIKMLHFFKRSITYKTCFLLCRMEYETNTCNNKNYAGDPRIKNRFYIFIVFGIF